MTRQRLLPAVATFAGFLLLALAFDHGADISMPWYWTIAAGIGLALVVLGLSDWE